MLDVKNAQIVDQRNNMSETVNEAVSKGEVEPVPDTEAPAQPVENLKPQSEVVLDQAKTALMELGHRVEDAEEILLHLLHKGFVIHKPAKL
jgi:hypothetical protein